ncbi:PREDICTED: adipocyte plasma membrane-associated protein-like isoform X2 [Priapulus caudatus]|uniref:Adipocyte plasma membrane-associated protein-like isoform X2 n=1 Tax=Priapulus caudatus TaxID=37621 RepID=A0ABM1DTI6_PRICU|nr:PREDICTED: adipocyte plasma membrane-associated protein-like isoform X2 [Priapulus caudatus]
MLRQRGKAHDKRPVISDLAATLDEIPPIQPDIHEEAERSHTVLLSAYSEPGSPWVSIISVLLLTVVVIPLSFIGLIDMLISSPIEPDRYRMLNPAPLDGVLEANDWLQTSEKLYEGTLERPTAMFAHEGYLYVGSVNNKILRFKNGKNETLHKRNVPCDAVHSEAECGRLQSISLTPAGDLLILDAYKGLYLVNMSTENREVVMLADTFELVEGAKLNYLTDMTVTSKGVLYFTDHSSKFDRMNAIYAWMDKSTGRLLAQGPNLKSSVPHFIFKELHSPSSLCMSPSEEFLLIAEAGKARILRYWVKTTKIGQREILADNLPGFPSIIRPSSAGGYWVGFSGTRQDGQFSLMDLFWPRVALRSTMTKFLPRSFITWMAFNRYGLVIELDQDGNILRSLHDTTGFVVPSVDMLVEHEGFLFIGSDISNYLVKVQL